MATSSGPEEARPVTPAETLQAAGTEQSSTDDESSYGFSRPEINKDALVGSVDYFERHVFLCYKGPQSWPAKVESADFDPLPHSMVAALRKHKNDMPKKTRLTIAEGFTSDSSGDVLIFPDMLKYKGLGHSDIESFVDEVLVAGKEWALGNAEPLVGSHVFICAHGSRDKRCGVCGPPLKERFTEEITKLGLEEKVSVKFCSHIGGHKYAGNVIIFSPTEDGMVTGHWYGYVTPNHVPELLEQHIGQGKIIERLWRGQMGMKEEEQKQLQQQRLGQAEGGGCPCSESQDQLCTRETAHQNGSDPKLDKSCREPSTLLPRVGSRDLLPRIGSRDLHKMEGDEEDDATILTRVLPVKKSWPARVLKMPKWAQDWESEDIKAALAVVGAATCVAVAYFLYRNSTKQQ